MPTSNDWLKHNHEELFDQATLTVTYLQDYMVRDRIGLGATTVQGQWYDTEFIPSYNGFQLAFSDWKDPSQRSPVKTQTLNDNESIFKPHYRKLYTGLLKESPLVTDEDLISMGLPSRSSGRTPSPVAKNFPGYEIDSSMIRRLGIHFFDLSKKATRGKPDGQHGAEICWAILDTPPTDVSELTNSSFSTRSPLILDFKESQRGKTIYFCLRWENTRGEKGPWSEIYNTIIP
ncbi:MAG: hypothetical protein LBL39_02575 [Planctomycetaceae bacterium]|jgi:hypothetical protein|nr:hypothetical protein [Planctomycetaceae bacterium]